MRPHDHLRVCTLGVLIVLACHAALGADGTSEELYYYNGTRKVRVALALDQVWVGALRGGHIEVIAPAPDRAALAKRSVAGAAATRAVLYSGGSRLRQNRHIVTGRLSLRLPPGAEIAPLLRRDGLKLTRTISYSPDTYIVTASGTGPLRAIDAANRLYENGDALWATPLVTTAVALKHTPNDPLFPSQWHLHNTGTQVPYSVAGEDINVTTAWDTVRGLGVNIAIVDEGVDLDHPDLMANLLTNVDYDYVDYDEDPSVESVGIGYGAHGTCAAGLAAAVGDNGTGVCGVAPQASIISLRLLTDLWDDITDDMVADAMLNSQHPNVVDVSSNSWGVPDDPYRAEGFGPLSLAALDSGVTSGRGGLGIVYVWAAGNGWANGDNADFDGFSNPRYTISVAATDPDGASSWYSEGGTSILVAAPAGAYDPDPLYNTALTTTDYSGVLGYTTGDYDDGFSGTSAATPVVSGVIALMLEANPDLGWRDVQAILLSTATKSSQTLVPWRTNGAGLTYHKYFGFGRVDAGAAVTAASSWDNLPPLEAPVGGVNTTPVTIDDVSTATSTIDVTAPAGFRVEHVEFHVDLTHSRRGQIDFELESPNGGGFYSLVEGRGAGDPIADLDWTFTSVAHWGEDPAGTWTLRAIDTTAGQDGQLNSWSLTIYGHSGAPTVSAISDRLILADVASAPIAFVVSDPDTPLDSLTVTATSSDQGLITNANLVISGTGANRTLVITPETGQTGTATIIVTADDGSASGSSSFDVEVVTGPTVSFSAATSNGLESFASPTISVDLSSYPGSDVTVDYEVTPGSAAGSGEDYTLASGSLTFGSGDSSLDIPLVVVDDTTDEGDETLVVALTFSADAVIVSPTTHTYTINDDDPTPQATFASGTASVNEGDPALALTVGLDRASSSAISIPFTVTDNETTSGDDYVLADGTLYIAAGGTQATITLAVTDDDDEEGAETLTIALQTPTNAVLGATSSVVVTIAASDQIAPTIAGITNQTILQDVASAPIPVLVDDANTPLDNLTVTATSDDQGLVQDANIVAGGTGGSRTLVITPVASQTGSTTITVTVSDGFQTATTTFTLTVDSGLETASFVTTTSSGNEADTAPAIEVQLSAAPGATVTVGYDVIGGDATGGGVDYTLAAGFLTFGATETTKSIVLGVVNDSLDEPDETVVIALSYSDGAAVGTNWQHTYTIRDDDLPPTPPGNDGVSCAAGSGANTASALAAALLLGLALTTRRALRAAVTRR